MRIAVWHNLPSGGAKRALYNHVRGLIARGHSIEAWCPPTADRNYLPLEEMITENVVPQRKYINCKDKKYCHIYKLNPYLSRFRDIDESCRLSAKRINQSGFDILLANSSLHICPPYIGRYINIPKILYLQEPYRPLYEAIPRLPWVPLDAPNSIKEIPRFIKNKIELDIKLIFRRYQACEELKNASAFDRVLVNSLYSRESVIRAYGINPRVCYLGVDADLFNDMKKQREKIVLGVGSVRYEKNIEFIIKAIACIRKPRPKFKWVANASISSCHDYVVALAQKMDVDFEILQNVSDDKLVEIYNTASVLSYAPHLEPFGFAPLEANACGLPVVAVAEGGVRETVYDGINGYLVEPTPSAMAEKIELLLNNSSVCKRLGAMGREMVIQKWSLNSSIDNLERHLFECFKNKGI